MMLNSKKKTAITLAILASVAIAPLPWMSLSWVIGRLGQHTALAQETGDPTTFPLPDSVPSDTSIRVDGSSSMRVINEALKANFEADYPDAAVELSANGTDTALQALLNGDIDLAAVGRPLTPEETAQGFVEVPISREKIAIIVGPDNPFDGNLTFEQFARMFRGEITGWSEVGGQPGPIRFVDRVDDSDTRLSLGRYDVFQAAPFETGDNAVQVDDDTTAVIEALGDDGIGYAIASQVLGQDDVVKIVSMHQTLPDNPAYPYSQPRGYVYYQEPTPAAATFLGYATADVGQAAIAEAREAEAEAVEAGESVIQASVPVAAPAIAGILYSSSLAYSPDGEMVAVASDEGLMRLFDAAGNPIGDPLEGLTGRISSLAFSPDGTRLVGGSDDGSIQVWDLDGNPMGNPWTAHESALTSLVFSPDGESIATAGVDGTVRLWDLEGNAIGDPLTGHEGAVNGLAFSPDGAAIASAGADGTVRLWDLEGNAVGDPLTGHEGAVNSVAFSPDGAAIASAGADGTVRLWDLEGNIIGAPLTGHEGAVNSVAFNPDGASLVSGGTDGILRQWNLDGTPISEPIATEQGAIAAVAFHPEGETLLSGGTDGTLRFWGVDGSPIGEPIAGYVSSVSPSRGEAPLWLWWLLPLALLALLLWWWLSRRKTAEESPAPTVSEEPSAEGSSTDLVAGISLAAAGNTDKALVRLNQAVEHQPESVMAWTARGNLLQQMGRSDDALQSFDHALAIQADSPQALAGKGSALAALGRSPEAIPFFDRAVTANRSLPSFNLGNLAAGGLLLSGAALTGKALTGKGRALLAVGQPTDALAAFDQALTADPKSVEAIAGRNQALSQIENISPPPPVSSSTPPLSSPPSSPSPPSTPPDAAPPAPPAPPSTRDISQAGGSAALAGGAALAGAGAAAMSAIGGDRAQTDVEATKFETGQHDLSAEALADVDQDLPDLPEGYGESRIVLLPRDPQWAYVYWDVPNEHRESLRQQGGTQLALRLYDVTDIDLNHQNPHNLIQHPCDELARDWHLPIPVSDRDYVAEIGYITNEGRWLMLARSAPVRVPPIYPSDWTDDQFITVGWDDDLRGKTLYTLLPPDQLKPGSSLIHEKVFGLAQSTESLRVAGSLFGSMQQVPQQAISSYIFPSGMGLWSASGAALTMSGIGMSGVGFSASAPPIRPRKFWLVADAELIVYGATEPDATVYIGDRPIPLNPDGTFRFQMSFQDGEIHYPIRAVAADGEQTRSIRMEFERETPQRNTNTKEEAVDEWFDT